MKVNFKEFIIAFFSLFLAVSCDTHDYDEAVSLLENEGAINTSESSSTLLSAESLVDNPNLIFEETVEGDSPFSTAHRVEVGDWDYALQYVDKPVFSGNKAARFEIREDQPLVKDGKRAEITIVKGAEGDISKNTWYSFAVYFPSDGFEKDSERDVINQWYQSGSPATSLRVDEDRILLETGNEMDSRERIDLGPVIKDSWQEFVFHFIHSHDSDGSIEIWLNGNKILTHEGGNMYDDVLPKWKIGLYKSAFKYGTSDVSKRIIYFDNIRVGNENATFEDMSSGISGTTTPEPEPEPEPVPEPEPIPTTEPDAEKVVSFTLIDASSDKDIMTLEEGTVLDLSSLDLKKINIRANTNPPTVGKVKFELSGEESNSRTDDEVPYALFGDDRNGNYYSWRPDEGSYTLTARTYDGEKGEGGDATGPTYSINFIIKK